MINHTLIKISAKIDAITKSRFLTSPKWLLCFLLLAVCFVYLPSIGVPPYLDDNSSILENSRVTDITNLPKIFAMFFHGRGLVQLTLALEWHFSRDPIKTMHITNIVLHIIAVILVFFTARSIWKFLYPSIQENPRWPYYGLIAACVFALHPINTEPVTYIIQRSEIMATIFYLLGLLLPLHIYAAFSANAQSRIKSLFGYFFMLVSVILCFFLGLSCKEIIVTFPAILFLLFVYSWRNEKTITILLKVFLFSLPVVLMLAGYLFFRKWTTGYFLFFPDLEARSPITNLYTQICIIVIYYIPRVFYPVHLYFRPTFPLVESMMDPRLHFAILVILLLLAVAVYLYRNKSEISLGILWFFIAIAPTSSFFPLWDLIAERRVYLSSIGVAIITESILFLFLQSKWRLVKQTAIAGSLGILLLFPTLAFMRNMEYRDPVRFWQKEHHYSPYSLENLHNYLYRLAEAGQNDQIKDILSNLDWNTLKKENEFIDTSSLDFMIRLMLINNTATAYATELARQNAEKFPRSTLHLNTYQVGLMSQGLFKDAMDVIDRTLAIDPNDIDTLVNKSLIYRRFNHFAESQACIDQALQIEPNSIFVLEEQLLLDEVTGKDSSEIKARIESLRKSNPYASGLEIKISM